MTSLVPRPVRVVDRIQESPDVFTLRLQYTNSDSHEGFAFLPGQFNMLYCHDLGEVPISIVSDPDEQGLITHTIRDVGRVTHGLALLERGDELGVRGPLGRGWPMVQAQGKDVIVMTGGLGCAPALSAINHIERQRERFGHLFILQGVRHRDDLIWRQRYRYWQTLPDTSVLLAADMPQADATLFRGNVVELFERVEVRAERSLAMLCGPEAMMLAAVGELRARGIADSAIWLSLERNMQCGTGNCGHCQLGPHFVCRDGPVFNYQEIADLFGTRGF
jgi:NAD(P)H-flavin reductase